MDESGTAVNDSRASHDIHQVAMHVRRDWDKEGLTDGGGGSSGCCCWDLATVSSSSSSFDSSTWSLPYCDLRQQKRRRQRRHFWPLSVMSCLLSSFHISSWPMSDRIFTSTRTNEAFGCGVSPNAHLLLLHYYYYNHYIIIIIITIIITFRLLIHSSFSTGWLLTSRKFV